MSDAPEVSIRPEAREWARLVRGRPALSVEARRFREQMGLPVDRPVVMAGHQAAFWHPGILVKYIAMTRVARQLDAEPVWIVVDQDTSNPFAISYPVRDEKRAGALARRTWKTSMVPTTGDEGGRIAGHIPTARVPSSAPTPLPADLGSAGAPGVAPGMRSIHDALARRARAGSVAKQYGEAACQLAAQVGGPARLIYATALAKTDLFVDLLGKMAADGGKAALAYQWAIGSQPAGFRSSYEHGDLPLWHIGPASRSQRESVHKIDVSKPEEYAPRALMLTGMLRLAGCDLFIHGLGGAGADGQSGYDAITERWFKEWLGVALAPMAMVTATVRLRIEGAGERITPEEIAKARWLAHAARHRPGLLGDQEGEAAREGAVATLMQMRWKRDAASKRVKLEVYRALQGTLERVRARHGAEIARLEAAASAAAARREEAEIVADRTWAFPLYERGQLEELAGEIGRRFQ